MPAVLTETVKLAGVVPLDGETLSQLLPEVTDAFTVAEPDVIPILNGWEPGGMVSSV
jgi:hypothetical protein